MAASVSIGPMDMDIRQRIAPMDMAMDIRRDVGATTEASAIEDQGSASLGFALVPKLQLGNQSLAGLYTAPGRD